MSYIINIEINGYTFQFGDNPFNYGVGTFINFHDDKIKEAIDTQNPDFFEALNQLFLKSEELDALYTITNFEHYNLQGHGWAALEEHYSFNDLEIFKRKALIVLSCNEANPEQLETAQTIIDILNGEYIFPPPPEKSPEKQAKALFQKKKSKLRLKLTIRDGYKCIDCGLDRENSLCIVQNKIDAFNYEVENLILRCRSCMNKAKKK